MNFLNAELRVDCHFEASAGHIWHHLEEKESGTEFFVVFAAAMTVVTQTRRVQYDDIRA